jgi:hypothetical protein
MKANREQIRQHAIQLLLDNRSGLRYSELVERVVAKYPETPGNSVSGAIWNLDTKFPEMVYKAARGVFRHKKYENESPTPATTAPEPAPAPEEGGRPKEEEFYEPFADFLVNDLGECTKAIPLGGNTFKDKWGTPDVVGKMESQASDIIKQQPEIVSAEIKVDPGNPITAFGQACAYKLFSHKVYIVVPDDLSPEDASKLDSLCQINGIGLVFLDKTNAQTPRFQVRVRAVRHEPDLFYTNRNMRLVEELLFR